MYKILIVTFIFLFSCSSSKKQAIAKNGQLDLSMFSFESEKTTELNGEWVFCWNSFCQKSNVHSSKETIQVPKNWAGQFISGNKLPEYGYSTYHLTIEINDINKFYAFKIIYINTAFKLFVNNKLIASNGSTGTDNESSVPHQIPGVYSFLADTSTLAIDIEVSNFHFRKAGLIRSIEFGLNKDVQSSWNNAIASDLFMAGALFIFAIYHIALFFLRKKEKSNLWFGLFCFLIATRTLLIDERFLVSLFPELNWFLTLKVIYSVIYLTLPTVLTFVFSLYPAHTKTTFIRLTQIISGICVLITLTTSPEIFVHFFQYFLYLILIFGIYIIIILYRASKFKEEGALFSLISFLLFYITVVIAILYEVDFPLLPSLLPYSLLAFIFSQSYLISYRFSKAFKEVEQLNLNLEKRVEERTESYLKAKLSADAANDAKSRYLSFITHELRTPITAVNGYTELLLEDLEDAKLSEYIDDVSKIKTASSHLISLVNNVLDMSKIEAGKMDVFVEEFDIKSLLIEIHTTIDPIFKLNKNKFKITISPEIDVMKNDRLKIKQILLNILGNATKFSQNGNVELSVAQKKNQILFKVKDSGVGMSEEQMQTLFDSYTQFNEDKNIKGTGLGMAISKKFSELMGGLISVESELNIGTTFTITLPHSFLNN